MPALNPILESLLILAAGLALLVFRNFGEDLAQGLKKEDLAEHQKFLPFLKWAILILGAGLTLDGLYLLFHVMKP